MSKAKGMLSDVLTKSNSALAKNDCVQGQFGEKDTNRLCHFPVGFQILKLCLSKLLATSSVKNIAFRFFIEILLCEQTVHLKIGFVQSLLKFGYIENIDFLIMAE